MNRFTTTRFRFAAITRRATWTFAVRTFAVLTFLHGAPGGAQVAPPVRGEIGRDGAPSQRAQARRAQMELRLQERINDIVRTRLALSDEQFTQLRTVSDRVENKRRMLRREEIATRGALRRELLTGAGASESRIAELLELMPKLERRRIDMMEQEQRELARFLAPSQRARYFALQDELRRNLQEAQRRRLGAEGASMMDSLDNPPRTARPLGTMRNRRPLR